MSAAQGTGKDRRPDPEDVARRFNDAINGRDLESLTALMTDDHRFVDSAGTVLEGRERVAAAWSSFFEHFPDYRNELDSVQSNETGVVILGHSICDVPELHGPAIWTAQIDGLQVAEWRVYEDDPETRRALGCTTTP